MHLMPLSPEATIKQLKFLIGQDKHDEIDEKADAIIQIIGNYPKNIEQIAPLLRDKPIDDFIKAQRFTWNNITSKRRFSIYDSMDMVPNDNALTLLQLLC